MKKIAKGFAGLLSAGALFLLTLSLAVQATLPRDFHVAEGEEFTINSMISVTAATNADTLHTAVYSKGNAYSLRLSLPGSGDRAAPAQARADIPIERKMVIPGGSPFGIKMFTKGLMIVGMSDIQTGTESCSPAKEAGLKIGDILTAIDGKPLSRNEDVARHVNEKGGEEVVFTLTRGEDELETTLKPVRTDYDQKFRAGIWVRDSSAGIGTLTYYDPETLGFAGLGHAVCDVDTGKVMPLSSGEIVGVSISGVNAGQSGKPGELRGSFTGPDPMGELLVNSDRGIFGILQPPGISADPIPMAHRHEIEAGPATILSTISGSHPREFGIVIEKINNLDSSGNKNMVIRVVDSRLLASTGGIVQGMSGSPVLQGGKLVGAVTHVFVNDPSRGYAIFAENMDDLLSQVESGEKAA